MFYLVDFVEGLVRCFEDLTDGLEVDAVLVEQRLVLLEAVNELPLVWLLLTSAWWLRRHHFALDASLDAIRTGFIFITADLALLTEYTTVAPGELHRRVMSRSDLALAGECSHVRGGRGRHGEYL